MESGKNDNLNGLPVSDEQRILSLNIDGLFNYGSNNELSSNMNDIYKDLQQVIEDNNDCKEKTRRRKNNKRRRRKD